jgi:hypothetical protein
MDYFTLSFEFSRSVRRRIPLLIGVQLAVAALCTSAMVWGRNRIFNTIGVSPDLIRGIMHDAFATEYETEKNKYTNRLNSFASKVVPYDLETEWKPPMAEEVHKNTLNTLERLKN